MNPVQNESPMSLLVFRFTLSMTWLNHKTMHVTVAKKKTVSVSRKLFVWCRDWNDDNFFHDGSFGLGSHFSYEILIMLMIPVLESSWQTRRQPKKQPYDDDQCHFLRLFLHHDSFRSYLLFCNPCKSWKRYCGRWYSAFTPEWRVREWLLLLGFDCSSVILDVSSLLDEDDDISFLFFLHSPHLLPWRLSWSLLDFLCSCVWWSVLQETYFFFVLYERPPTFWWCVGSLWSEFLPEAWLVLHWISCCSFLSCCLCFSDVLLAFFFVSLFLLVVFLSLFSRCFSLWSPSLFLPLCPPPSLLLLFIDSFPAKLVCRWSSCSFSSFPGRRLLS